MFIMSASSAGEAGRPTTEQTGTGARVRPASSTESRTATTPTAASAAAKTNVVPRNATEAAAGGVRGGGTNASSTALDDGHSAGTGAGESADDEDDHPTGVADRETGAGNSSGGSIVGAEGDDEAAVGEANDGEGGGGNGDGVAEGAGAESSGPDVGWRVKLYQLNDEGQWDDRGTGHISCRFVESLGGIALVVLAEYDGRELMQSKVGELGVVTRTRVGPLSSHASCLVGL